ncbi:MAG: tRNA guanosine(34) transglycosylase Tgt [Leptospiraceae bacterium]|nr:tRNA guanosine(34) transglycosylase Tgt [Leptospiraceae bacterium]MDW8306684.1 tRNA guanosine(34) transglycosylase Tgt [Leptospiraceae bacterium]
MARFYFFLQKGTTGPRAGLLRFETGLEVKTPLFMPVGTQGSVKAMGQEDLESIGYRLILANTYHLYLRPGLELMAKLGGLKKFMAWPYALLTDSGGFQAFSLSSLREYRDDGVLFRSHWDGSRHYFNPRKVLEIQRILESDIVMPLDDCAEYPATPERLSLALERTHRWLQDSVEYYISSGMNEKQSLFGIIQGGVEEEFREKSVQFVTTLPLPGFAIGGLSVGEKNEEFLKALRFTCALLPVEKPRYLMGVGSIPEILAAVESGVDMFDCVLPTRNARNGQLLTSEGKINLRNEKFKDRADPPDPRCGCPVCQRYTLAYLRHLHKSREILAYMLSTYHNLYFMYHFMDSMRLAIFEDRWTSFKEGYLKVYTSKSPAA